MYCVWSVKCTVCEVWNTAYRVWSGKCTACEVCSILWSMKYSLPRVKWEMYCMWSVKYIVLGVWNITYRVWSGKCTVCEVWSVKYTVLGVWYSLPRGKWEMHCVWSILCLECEIQPNACEVGNILRAKCEIYCAWSVKYSLPRVKWETYCVLSILCLECEIQPTTCEVGNILHEKCEVYCVWSVKCLSTSKNLRCLGQKYLHFNSTTSLQQNLAICTRTNSFPVRSTQRWRNGKKRSGHIRTTGWRRCVKL